MKKFTLLLVIGLAIFLACVDPDEPDVPNGKDFKNSKVEYVGTNLITDIYFYDNFALSEFFYYFDHNNANGAEFLVKCRSGAFQVLKESAPGLYDILKYSGVPTVNGTHYHLEFPLDAIEIIPDAVTYYWFFAMDGKDRMPDSGKKQLNIIH